MSRLVSLWACARSFLLFRIFLVHSVFAQQTGSISGKVMDTRGAVLPGVTVEARSTVLPGPRDTVTGGDGTYQLPALPPGDYTVTFTLDGMQTVTRQVQRPARRDDHAATPRWRSRASPKR